MKHLTENQSKVLEYLKANPDTFYTPTQIATAVWPGTNRHSAHTSPILRRLIAKRLVEPGLGKYKYKQETD